MTDRKQRQSKKSTVSGQTVDIVTNAPVPPDGGWGWIVVMSSFFISVLVDGVCYTFGVFYNHFLFHYNESRSATSWAGSVLNGTYLTVGVVVSALANKYGCRKVCIAGAFISSLGFFLSSFSPSMAVVTVLYGFMAGVGFGLMYLPALVMVGYYFEEKRAFATGIAVCGSGIGAFVFAPLVEYLIEIYTWKQALWIIAGIVFHGALFGAFYRPLKPIITIVQATDEEILMEAVRRPVPIRNSAPSSRHGSISKNSAPSSRHGSVSSKHNYKRPQDRDSLKVPDIIVTSAESTELLNETAFCEKPNTGDKGAESNNDFLALTWEDAPRGRAMTHDPITLRDCSSHNNLSNNNTRVKLKVSDVYGMETNNRYRSQNHLLRLAKSQDSVFRHVKQNDMQSVAVHGFLDVARPLYRKDIFYSGSVYHLPQFMSHNSINEYVKSVTRIPDEEDSRLSRCLKWLHMPKVARDIFDDMLDMTILRSYTFIVYALACTLIMIGFFVPFMYMPPLAEEVVGVSHQKAAFLVSILGITNTVGRIITGIVCDRKGVDCILVNNVTIILAGLATIIVPFFQNYAVLATYCAVFGLCVSPFVSLRTIIVVELLGLDKLSNSFGYITMFQGASSFVGVPMAGALADYTGTYNTGFYLSGVVLAFSGFIGLFLRRIKRWEETRENKKIKNKKSLLVNSS